MTRLNRIIGIILSVAFLLIITITGLFLWDEALVTDFSITNLSPCLSHIFGTDQMGRDMFTRSLAGISVSICIGLLTAFLSGIIAITLSSFSVLLGKKADGFFTWFTDLFMGIPHLLLLILISFACGKGFVGVVVGISLSHWMSLSRLLRSEMLSVVNSGYIKTSQKLGVSKFTLLVKHILPNIMPQFLKGIILLFPHAILHEAAISFLGFGLSPEQAAIGIILSESMSYLAIGNWWLALFPGILLIVTVMLFDYIGRSIKDLTDSNTMHQ